MNKKLLGYCGVDSGQLLLTDPCYLNGWKNNNYTDDEEKDGNYSYNGACHLTCSDDMGGQLINKLGIDIAVAFSTGYGDGCYPVYAIYKDNRIQKIEVKFF